MAVLGSCSRTDFTAPVYTRRPIDDRISRQCQCRKLVSPDRTCKKNDTPLDMRSSSDMQMPSWFNLPNVPRFFSMRVRFGFKSTQSFIKFSFVWVSAWHHPAVYRLLLLEENLGGFIRSLFVHKQSNPIYGTKSNLFWLSFCFQKTTSSTNAEFTRLTGKTWTTRAQMNYPITRDRRAKLNQSNSSLVSHQNPLPMLPVMESGQRSCLICNLGAACPVKLSEFWVHRKN